MPSLSQFLAALPESERSKLIDHSRRLEIAAGTPFLAAGRGIEYCYFVERGLVSCILRLPDGFESAAAMIGPEGMFGIGTLAEVEQPPVQAKIVEPGLLVRRIPVAILRESLKASPEVLAHFLKFFQALMFQSAQSSTCNLRHRLKQRLARWLLMAFDRSPEDELLLTQEFLSTIVGARRASVTLAAHELRDAGAIHYRHGHIFLRDRPRLEAEACECYSIIRGQYQRLLGWPRNQELER